MRLLVATRETNLEREKTKGTHSQCIYYKYVFIRIVCEDERKDRLKRKKHHTACWLCGQASGSFQIEQLRIEGQAFHFHFFDKHQTTLQLDFYEYSLLLITMLFSSHYLTLSFYCFNFHSVYEFQATL